MSDIEKEIDTRPKAMLIKTYRENYRSKDGKSIYTKLLITYRDEKGKKHRMAINRPKTTYYILKDPNGPLKHGPAYVQASDVDAIEIEYDKLYRDIAERTNTFGFYEYILSTPGKDSNSNSLKNLFRLPQVYNADLDIEDQYIAKFYKKYQLYSLPLHKVYYDIETDTYPNGLDKRPTHIGFPTPETVPSPIDIITLMDGKYKTVYSFVLNNQKNKSLQEFKTNIKDFKEDLKEKLTNDSLKYTENANDLIDKLRKKYNYDESVPEYARAFRELIDKLKDKKEVTSTFVPSEITVKFYDDEKELIKAFFDTIHEIDPDYAFGWNSAGFDCRYLFNRLKRLYELDKSFTGDARLQAAEDVCDKRYLYNNANGQAISFTPKAYVTYDNSQQVGERFSSVKIVDGINWIDQMELYGVVHAGEGVKDSYTLDFTASELIDNEKLEFDKGDVTNAAWYNFRQFAEYNIRDVLLLFLLDEFCDDSSLLDVMSHLMYTRREKAFSQSTALQNFVSFISHENGWIMNSNKNQSYGNEDSSYFEMRFMPKNPIMEFENRYIEEFERIDSHGAICSDPTLAEQVGVEIVPHVRSMYLFNTVIDFDFSSLYPSIFMNQNIDTMTLIGRYYLIDDNITRRLTEKFHFRKIATNTQNVSEELIDAVMAQDVNFIASAYMNIDTVEEMISEIGTIIKNKNS